MRRGGCRVNIALGRLGFLVTAGGLLFRGAGVYDMEH